MSDQSKPFGGVGTVSVNGLDFSASYTLSIADGPQGKECTGYLTGLSASNQFELITATTDIVLAFQSGQRMKIKFYGSAKNEPARIKVIT